MDTSQGAAMKVLTIDGGGIRGLYSAKVLAVFEERYGAVHEHFDLVCGTSTGGLIALALAMGIPATTVVDLYVHRGREIFPPAPRRFAWLAQFLGRIRQIVGSGKYSNKALRAVLEDLFGEMRLRDAKCLVCVPSYSITNGRPYIFRFDHPEGRLGRDNDLRCVDVALATSAAPTFFPIVEIDGVHDQLVDGGICANNPALVALVELLRHFVGEDKAYQRAVLLSLETLRVPATMPVQAELDKGAIAWREDLVNCFMEGQASVTNYVMKQLSQSSFLPFEYVRIDSPSLSVDQARHLTLDNASDEALNTLLAAGSRVGNDWSVRDEVATLFESPRTYCMPNEEAEKRG